MAKDLAIVLNNGSVNSAVVTALAAQRFRPILLYAEISPQAGSRARAAYDQQVAHFKPYREHSVPMPFLAGVGNTTQPSASAADPRQHAAAVGGQMLELLPLLAAAARYAVHYQAAAIYLGMRVGPHADELAHATEYVQIWNELIQLPCGQGDLETHAPLLELEPWQVIDVGFQTAAPFDRTWSCVEELSDPCWACRGCRGREAAFQQAAKSDPLRVVRKV
jgi:7-cyano-7-deazaguanine synthase in queuosine biosynthesis